MTRTGGAHERRAAAQLTDHEFVSALGNLDPRRQAGTFRALDVDVVGNYVTGQRSDKDEIRDGNRRALYCTICRLAPEVRACVCIDRNNSAFAKVVTVHRYNLPQKMRRESSRSENERTFGKLES